MFVSSRRFGPQQIKICVRAGSISLILVCLSFIRCRLLMPSVLLILTNSFPDRRLNDLVGASASDFLSGSGFPDRPVSALGRNKCDLPCSSAVVGSDLNKSRSAFERGPFR